MTDQPVPELLRAWRAGRGLSQSQAAELLRVPLRTLQDWEGGQRPARATEGLLRLVLEHV